jgi:hypothetical protein
MAYPTSSTRVGYVGTELIGDVLTKANFDKGPAGLVAYNRIVTDSSASGATTAVTGLQPAFTAGTSRFYKITIFCSNITTTGSGTASLEIWDITGNAKIGGFSILAQSFGAGIYSGGTCVAYHQPAAGSQTYGFKTTTSATTVQVGASSTAPAIILVEDVGIAF